MVQPLDGQRLTLAKKYTARDSTFQVFGRLQKDSLGASTKYIIGEQILTCSPNTDREERWYVNVIADPTVIDSDQGIYEYTITTSGIESDNYEIPPTLSDSSKQKDHNFGDTVMIGISSAYFGDLVGSFSTATVTNSAVAGENVTTLLACSKDSGSLYLFNSSTRPNLIGIVQTTTTSGNSAPYYTNGALVPGFTGLTDGARYYAQDAGVINTTSTGIFLGKAEGTTAIRIMLADAPRTVASEVEAKAGTDNADVMTPLRTRQSLLLLQPEYQNDLSVLAALTTGGTGTISIVAGSLKFSNTAGQLSTVEFDNNILGDIGTEFDGQWMFDLLTLGPNLSVADMEMFVGISNATLTTTDPTAVNSNFAGFYIKNEAGTINIYALTQRGTATQTKELIATGSPVAGTEFIIDATFGTDVKYYINGILEATHDTVANIPNVADRYYMWQHNGSAGGPSTANFTQFKSKKLA